MCANKTALIGMTVVFWLTALVVLASGDNNNDFSKLKGPYMGQKPPGDTPALFADGLLANNYPSFHSSLMFTADGYACYWQAKLSEGVWVMVSSRLEGDRWTEPAIVPFSKPEYRDDCPFLSYDEQELFFISRRPDVEGDESRKENIWVVNKTSHGWGTPKPLPPIINVMSMIHWQVSVDNRGTLYFSTYQMEPRGRRGDIYYSELVNGEYSKPVKLGPNINSPDYEFSPFIARDGSYLIFSRETFGVGNCRLWISFRDDDGNWSEAINLYDNHGIKGICPVVSRDMKYLFFLDWVNSRSQPFWVDAGFIDDLRPEESNQETKP